MTSPKRHGATGAGRVRRSYISILHLTGLVLGASLLTLPCAHTALATINLTGDFIQLPIDDSGQPGRFMGTGNSHGAKFNPAGSGGGAGTDFWVWGAPIANYTVAVGGSTFKTNGAGWASGPTVVDTSSGTVKSAVISGEPVAGLSFQRVVSFADAAQSVAITDTLTNATGAPLSQVATLDSVDPDQDVVCCGTLVTLNDVVTGVAANDLVVATGATSGLTVGFGSPDTRRVADASGFSNTNPYAIIASPTDPNGAAGDISINLAVNYGTLPSGEAASATWFIVFGTSKDGAVATYQASVPTCGNSLIETGEQCDDGNAAGGDGCSANCRIEICYACAGQPSACSPVVAGSACPSDGNACTLDQCDGAGACTHPAASSGTPCADDGDACTLDQCNGAGSCSHPAAPSGTLCPDEGNVCTLDRCDGAGACTHVGSASLVGTACPDDGKGCTFDRCNGAGVCTHPAVPGDTPCNDDANACTVDRCDTGGTCRQVGTVVCAAPECSYPGACDPSSGACTGCPAGYTAGGGGCQKAYRIDLAALDNQLNSCFPGHQFSDCSSPFGFHWLDAGDASVGPVIRVDVQLEAGIECSQMTHQVTLNSAPIGSYTHAGVCSCASPRAPQVLANVDTASYVKGGANAVSIDSVSCDGLSQDANGAYGVVTVAYQSPGLIPRAAGTACGDDGNPCTLDRCDGAGACGHPAGNAGVVCRPVAGECDVAESCDGVNSACPGDAVTPDGTRCGGGNNNTCLNACAAGVCAAHVAPQCCGNGALDAGEGCDDGNQVGGDQCSSSCRIELDHFQCYAGRVRAPQPDIAPLQLVDQFGTLTQKVIKVATLCSPASKNDEDPSAPAHADHLEGYKIKPLVTRPRFVPVRNQQVVNQFGTGFVDVLRPLRLLVPTATSLAGPPPVPAAPGIDHFTCYRVRRTRGTPAFAPRTVTLDDEFGSTSVDVRQPTVLCAPADKNGEDPGAARHLAHLLCYRIRKPFDPVRGVFTNNQFGPGQLDPTRRYELCVPTVTNP